MMGVIAFPDRRLDRIFRALDDRLLQVASGWWRLRVYSVRILDEGVWIQLDAIGPQTIAMTVRHPVGASVDQIVCALASRLVGADDRPSAVRIAAVVHPRARTANLYTARDQE